MNNIPQPPKPTKKIIFGVDYAKGVIRTVIIPLSSVPKELRDIMEENERKFDEFWKQQAERKASQQ